IFVLPRSGGSTAPRFAREKPMSRTLSAKTFLIGLPLTPVRLPLRSEADHIRIAVGVHDHKKSGVIAHSEGHEPHLIDRVRILSSESGDVLQGCMDICLPWQQLQKRRVPPKTFRSGSDAAASACHLFRNGITLGSAAEGVSGSIRRKNPGDTFHRWPVSAMT